MKKRSRSNSVDASGTNGGIVDSYFIVVDCKTELLKSKAAVELETALLNSSPGPRGRSSPISRHLESPIHPACPSGTPSTPVDIKSVPQIRKLSCKKLIYSYTFGEPTSTSTSSNDSSPKIVKKNTNRSPSSSRTCRSSSVSKGSSSTNHFKNHIEWTIGPINAVQKRKH